MSEPANLAEAIARLKVAGPAIRDNLADAEACIAWLEANPPAGKGEEIARAARDVATGHALLNRGGYLLEDATGQEDGAYGAGGTSKGPGGGGG